jgi:hypothetical protein
MYDLSANTWTQSPVIGPSPRSGPALASLGEDQVLLFGGNSAGDYDGQTWLASGFHVEYRVYLPLVAR